MNPTELSVAHVKPAATIISFTNIGNPHGHTIKAAMFMGNRQYPRTQTLWKNEIVPPRSSVLIVIITDPTLIRQNTMLNTKLAVSSVFSVALEELDSDSVKDSSMHRRSGPHRSQSRSSFAFSSCTFGKSTYFSLKPIRFTSRSIVSITGSFSVLVFTTPSKFV